jgi:hypothetical protein
MATAVFHPWKEATLFGVLPQMSGIFIGFKLTRRFFIWDLRGLGKCSMPMLPGLRGVPAIF